MWGGGNPSFVGAVLLLLTQLFPKSLRQSLGATLTDSVSEGLKERDRFIHLVITETGWGGIVHGRTKLAWQTRRTPGRAF